MKPDGERQSFLIGGPLHLRCGALPDDQQAALRSLLSLHLVPARNRGVLRAERHDRSRPRDSAEGRAGGGEHALEQRKGAEDRPLPDLPYRLMEQLRRRRGCCALRPRRDARRAASPAARYPYLHLGEAALGRACTGYAGGRGVLRAREVLAEGKPRAPSQSAGERAQQVEARQPPCTSLPPGLRMPARSRNSTSPPGSPPTRASCPMSIWHRCRSTSARRCGESPSPKACRSCSSPKQRAEWSAGWPSARAAMRARPRTPP